VDYEVTMGQLLLERGALNSKTPVTLGTGGDKGI